MGRIGLALLALIGYKQSSQIYVQRFELFLRKIAKKRYGLTAVLRIHYILMRIRIPYPHLKIMDHEHLFKFYWLFNRRRIFELFSFHLFLCNNLINYQDIFDNLSFFVTVQIWVLRAKDFLFQFLVDILPLDTDPGSQNVAEPYRDKWKNRRKYELLRQLDQTNVRENPKVYLNLKQSWIKNCITMLKLP